jgi:dUTP pyrophosphatase
MNLAGMSYYASFFVYICQSFTKIQMIKYRFSDSSTGLGGIERPSTQGSAGYDLRVDRIAEVVITAEKTGFWLHFGIAVELPAGFFARIDLRSSVGREIQQRSSGIIDADYRGELRCYIESQNPKYVKGLAGKRVAQLTLYALENQHELIEAHELSTTQRGAGGFGSTNNESWWKHQLPGEPDGKKDGTDFDLLATRKLGKTNKTLKDKIRSVVDSLLFPVFPH